MNITRKKAIIAIVILAVLAAVIFCITKIQENNRLEEMRANASPDASAVEIYPESIIDAGIKEDSDSPKTEGDQATQSEKCEHSYNDGFCVKCGAECPHKWEDGVCTLCKMVCNHVRHYRTTNNCVVCGEKVAHNMVNAQCTRCGIQPVFTGDVLPEQYYLECDEQGTVETLTYKTPYIGRDEDVVKMAKVYLPYGYDPHDLNQKYNLIILIHGNNGDESHFVDREFYYGGNYGGTNRTSMRTIYDNMIKNGDCEPFIAVSITTYVYIDDVRYDTDGGQLGPELRNVLMPYLAEHYHTYAEDGSLESLIAARQHFAIAGYSNGSLRTIDTGILRNFDIFGNFGFFAGIAAGDYIIRTINDEANADYPIYCLFSGAGKSEGMRQSVDTFFWYILNHCEDKLSYGSNAFYIETNSGHDWISCHLDIYDALLVMFQDTSVGR